MDNTEKIQYKRRLKQYGLTLIGARIAAARDAIDQAQQAANQEGKSSAGDKYETARAMSHLQKDMFSRQLAEYTKEQAALHAVNVEICYPSVTTGAFIDCGDLALFMAAGLGKQVVDGKTILFLSPQAPLASLLLHKKKGDTLSFGNTSHNISDVY